MKNDNSFWEGISCAFVLLSFFVAVHYFTVELDAPVEESDQHSPYLIQTVPGQSSVAFKITYTAFQATNGSEVLLTLTNETGSTLKIHLPTNVSGHPLVITNNHTHPW